jgi:hypothetical protein
MAIKVLSDPPTKQQIQDEYISQLEAENDVTESWVARRMWAAYLVAAMRKARTHAELLDLLRTSTLRGMGNAFDMFTGERPREAYGRADERLANTFWTDGRVIYQTAGGKLAPNLNDDRLSIDLEQVGFIAFDGGELQQWQIDFVERRGKADNTEGWLAQKVMQYHHAQPRYIQADDFVCVVCKHSGILKDYGGEYRATCSKGWPLDLEADPVTCSQLEEPEEGTRT